MYKVSVVLSTYNGEKYIYKQLASIYNQIDDIHEILIYDDCSKDSTVDICRNFMRGTEKCKIRVNKNNVGWKKNFFYLLYDCTGDIIFYCDQDDEWNDSKVKDMVNVFIKHPDALCVSSDWAVIDGNGDSIDEACEVGKNTGVIEKITLDGKYFFNVPRGCSMAIKRDLLNYINKEYVFNNETGGTDRILCHIALLLGGMYKFHKNLFNYRVHDNNVTSNIEKMSSAMYGQDTLNNRIKIVNLDTLFFFSCRSVFKDKIILVKAEKIYQYMTARATFLENRSFKSLVVAISQAWSLYALYKVICDGIYLCGYHKKIGKLINCVLAKLRRSFIW